MSFFYNTFNSSEFVGRQNDFERVNEILKNKKRGVLIFEGERGIGKSTFLLELYRRLNEENEIKPFFISLFPYFADEFKESKNIWLNSIRPFQEQDISNILRKIAFYFGFDFIESENLDIQTDYFARAFAYKKLKTTPVLLVDSVYECSNNVRSKIEKYIFSPMLSASQVFFILSGRGKRAIWNNPNFQKAEIYTLAPMTRFEIKKQLEKMHKLNNLKYDQIADFCSGNPLFAKIIANSKPKKLFTDLISEAIDTIIKTCLPAQEQEKQKYLQIRANIEKLSLVNIPFRSSDIEEYLYPNIINQKEETQKFINILLYSGLVYYDGKGYKVNSSLKNLVRNWLINKRQYGDYYQHLLDVSEKLQKSYPSAQSWYKKMPINEQ